MYTQTRNISIEKLITYPMSIKCMYNLLKLEINHFMFKSVSLKELIQYPREEFIS